MTVVLLTGATGFIGRVTHRALASRGHRVRVLLRDRGRAAALAAPAESIVYGDLQVLDSLRDVCSGCTTVVHLAAAVDPALQHDPVAVDAINREATIALGEAAVRAGVSTFVFASSIAAMGLRSGATTAEAFCLPTTPYGAAKLAAERALRTMRTSAFRVITLRPPTVYGPGERYNFLSLVRAVDRGLFRIVGSGDNVMPLCTDDNFARAACSAVEGQLPAGTYLVADADQYPLARVHRAILGALRRSEPRLHLPRALAMVLGAANELASLVLPIPPILSRARVRTLTCDQPFDVGPLLAAGVALDAPLEAHVVRTIAEYRSASLLPG
jgi:UDP-glucose 4-epimerase